MRKLDMFAAAALLLITPAAFAQKSVKAPKNLTFGYVDGDDVVSIEVDGDEVTVLLNGADMPKERYKHEGSVLRCMDEHGRPVAIVNLHGTGGTLRTLTRRPHRMRLGVSLRTMDEALAEHLGLEADKTLYIADVVNDQAGDKAGLKKHDVVTHIDGETPATKERLGEILADKSPGDKLELRVVRRGGDADVVVVLEAAEPSSFFYDGWYGPFSTTYESFPQFAQTARDLSMVEYLTLANQAKGVADKKKAWSPFLTTKRNAKNQSDFVQLLQANKKKAASKDRDDLEKQLRALEKRLGSLEKLLKGLDKKIK